MSDIDEYAPYVDASEDDTDDLLVAGGSVPETYSLPDEAPRVELLTQFESVLGREIDRERKTRAATDRPIVRVDTNVSGQVLFQRYTLTTAAPIQIAREKPYRGDLIITCYSGTAYVGLHSGILVGGADTVSVVSAVASVNNVRKIRTRTALWAIGDGVIDVQEEFD